jgi:hypothetical protein
MISGGMAAINREAGSKMSARHKFSAARSACLLIAGACLAFAGPVPDARAQTAASCGEADMAVLPSPVAP